MTKIINAEEMATELFKCDSQIKTWEKKRRDVIQWFVDNGFAGKEVMTKSGDYKVAFSPGIQRALNVDRLVSEIGIELYERLLSKKKDGVKLSLSDVSNLIDVDAVSDDVKATVKATLRKV